MQLREFKDIDIRIDRANQSISSNIVTKAGDKNGRNLLVQITNDGQVVDQSGLTVHLAWKHEGTSGVGLDLFGIEDASAGIFRLDFTQEMLKVGQVFCTIVIQDGTNITHSRNFYITVEETAVDETAIEGDNSFTSLQTALSSIPAFVDGLETDYIARADAMEALYPTRLTQLEDNELECITLKVDAGLFDFEILNVPDLTWHFADGTTSTDSRPAKTLTSAQTVRATGSFGLYSDVIEIDGYDTETLFTGNLKSFPDKINSLYLDYSTSATIDLADLPYITRSLSLFNCTNVTGDLSDLKNTTYLLNLFNCLNITGNVGDLPRVTYFLNIEKCANISGDIADLPRVTYYLSAGDCPLLTGDVANLPNTSSTLKIGGSTGITGNASAIPRVTFSLEIDGLTGITGTISDLPTPNHTLNMNGCTGITGAIGDLPPVSSYVGVANCPSLAGAVPSTQTASYIEVTGTGMTSTDIDNSLDNLVVAGTTNGTFEAVDKSRTTASDASYNTLISRGWDILLL